MTQFNSMFVLLATAIFLIATSSVEAFTVTSPISTHTHTSYKQASSFSSSTTSLQMNTYDILESSTETIAAATVDPTTALTQALGAVLNTPLILVVPIVAAISVASVIAWFIVSYANPADPDE